MTVSIPMTIGYESTGDIEMPADVTDDRTTAFITAIQETSAQVETAADAGTADTTAIEDEAA